MSNNLQASIAFIVVCALLCSAIQNLGSFFCLAVSLCLYGFVLWNEKEKKSEIQSLKDQIAELHNKINAIQLSRVIR